MIGTTVGKYRILDRLGRGGMGTVYKALDETLDREVAIKVLNPDLGDAEVLKRFRAEAVSLARLNHSGIATIYELHRHADDLLMVMEYVRGETLQTLSERLGPLEPPQAAYICIQILDALTHAHRAGVVHRDLKPANVMVSDTGIVKVMDFGIARMLGSEHFTHAGYMMGTPAYMAPEQVLGHEVDGRADLYAVGVLFYRLLSRELPFQADTAIAMAQKQVADAPTPIATFRPGLPAWCEATIARALSKAPADRFQTAEAFRAAILSAVTPVTLGELPTMATPTAGMLKTSDLTLSAARRSLATVPSAASPAGAVGAAGSTAVSAGPATASSIERTGTTVVLGRGHLITLSALLVVLVAGIAALGVAVLRRGSDSPQTTAAAPVDAGKPADTPVTPPVEPPPPPVAPAVSSAGAPAAAPTPAPPVAAPSKPQVKASTPAPPSTKAPAPGPAEPSELPAPKPAATPAKPTVAPIVFADIKVAVAQGKGLRERNAVLTLAGDHLSLSDPAGAAQILSVEYASIVRAVFSRSKQPKWTGADGKEMTASVDLGKLGFFRGERNWLILITSGDPVFLRFDDKDRRAVLAAAEQRLGVSIQTVR